MSKISLYELTNDVVALFDLLTDEEVEQEQVEEAIKQVNELITKKGENIIRYINNYRDMAKSAKEEAKRLTEVSKAMDKKADKLEGYVVDCMVRANLDRIDTPAGTMFKRRNPGKLEIINEDLVPDVYKSVEVVKTNKIDKAAIKKDIKGIDNAGLAAMGVQMLEGDLKLKIK